MARVNAYLSSEPIPIHTRANITSPESETDFFIGSLFKMVNPYQFVISVDVARELVSTLTHKFVEAKLADPPVAKVVSAAQAEMQLIGERLAELLDEGKSSIEPKVDAQLAKDIRDRVSTIALFGPGSELSLFLRECQVIYDTLVKNNGALVEAEFTRKLKLRINFDYLGQLNATNEDMSTFVEFKCYMEENHSSQESHYQCLEELEGLQILKSESYKDFALRINLLTRRVETVVAARWAKKYSTASVKTDPGAAAKPGVTGAMQAHDVFELIAGLYLLKAVRQDAQTYAAICGDLDKCWNACAIANRAAGFADKCQPEVIVSEPNLVHYTSQKPRQGYGVCRDFLRSICRRDKCRYSHDQSVKDIVDEAKDSAKDKASTEVGSVRNQIDLVHLAQAQPPPPDQYTHFDINLDNVQGFN